jgi:para-aminobenzoate synthetase component 1
VFRHQLPEWSSRFNVGLFLDTNGYNDPYGRFDLLLAAGARRFIESGAEGAWDRLAHFRSSCRDWVVGHCCYELKDSAFGPGSPKPDGIGLPALYFFQPDILLLVRGTEVHIGIDGDRHAARAILEEITSLPAAPDPGARRPISWQSRMTDTEYLGAVRQLQRHLHRGDAYEVNFCREYFAEEVALSPPALFRRLNSLSPAPFSAYYRNGDRHLACSSPERFLRKDGSRVLSQPMKGTASRGRDAGEDERNKAALAASSKERSENVMAVDLVRSDLSGIAAAGSVRVTELFGVYSFPTVHQMVSTVEAVAAAGVKAEDILSRAFPMGSMTGAPKHRVLQLIDTYEHSKRGLFSGSVGYFTPEGDFDFNVVIRSLAYHAGTRYLSFQTGSGITIYSDPERELEECVLKGRALRQAAETS